MKPFRLPLIAIFGFLVAIAQARPGAAQTTADQPPTITTTGMGEVRRAPDVAYVSIGVSVQESTGASAAATMNATLAAIVDTLATLGFPRESLPTRRFSV